MLEGGARPGMCRLKRCKFRAGRIDAAYDVGVLGREGDTPTVRPLEVTWELLAGAVRKDPAIRPADGGVPLELRSPFRVLEADIPARAMRIRVSPFDAKYQRLWRLFEPEYLRRALEPVWGTPPPAAAGHRPTVLRYAPGHRHLIRFDPIAANREDDVIFAKVRQGKHAIQSLQFERELEALAEEAGLGMQVVHRLARVPEDAVDLYPKAPGESLTQLLRRRRSAVFGVLAQLGCELRRLHDAARGPASVLVPRGFDDELWATAVENEHVRLLIPGAALRIDDILSTARDLDGRLAPESPTVCHGDFKTEHVWAGTDGGFRLIDCDSAVVGEPAIDLGKFLADLAWWQAACARPGFPEARAAFLEGYGLGTQPGAERRARLYEAVASVRVTLRRIRLADEDWVSGVDSVIDRAQAMLDRLRGPAVARPRSGL